MYDLFGGVSKFIQPDNLKAAILYNNKKGISVTPAFTELAMHYDTIVLPTRPRQPQDKSMVETMVRVVQNKVLAKYRDFHFFSLIHLNHILSEELKVINYEVTKTYPKGRFQNYLDIDYPYLQPLPKHQFDICEWFYDVKANGYILNILGCQYSVNYSYAHQKFDIKITDKLVEIFFKKQAIALHQRIYSGASIKEEHLPPNHRVFEELKPEKLMEWAISVGENTGFVIEYILENKANYANNLKKLNKIKRMLIESAETNENIELAFKHIINLNAFSATQIEMVIKSKSYLNNSLKSKSKQNSPLHKNIRGASYYANKNKGAKHVITSCL